MPQQPDLERIAAAQQAAQAQQAAPTKEKKKNSLVDIIKSPFGLMAKGANSLEHVVDRGIVRSAIPAYFATAVAAPAFLINPIGALILGAGTYAFSYLAANTAYKIPRNLLLLPKYTYDLVKATTGSIFKHPIKAIGAITAQALKAPFKIVKYVIKFPFEGGRYKPVLNKETGSLERKRVVEDSKIVKWLGRATGCFLGYSAINQIGITDLFHTAKEKIYSLYQSIKPNLPTLRHKSGRLLSDGIASIYNSTKNLFSGYSTKLA